ncbi:MAG: redox-sensing transcriptional repressor Rex [Candidatus Omnitrophica bacterium]|nr:redox-sensing transcriptional repressor Rex [Candidatus Omnitrophota bacterium]
MLKKIPEETITRLSYYLRALLFFKEKDITIISSKRLADFLKISHHQLRKDLSYFGQFGRKGVGYSCVRLIESIREILGLNREWGACVVGFGNLGRALSFYKGFKDEGIAIKAAFDISENKVNKDYANLKVYPLEKMEKVIRKEKIQIGIIAVPKEAAEAAATRLAECGIKAIFNLAPVKLDIPKDVIVKDVDLSCQLTSLTYHLKLLEAKQS